MKDSTWELKEEPLKGPERDHSMVPPEPSLSRCAPSGLLLTEVRAPRDKLFAILPHVVEMSNDAPKAWQDRWKPYTCSHHSPSSSCQPGSVFYPSKPSLQLSTTCRAFDKITIRPLSLSLSN